MNDKKAYKLITLPEQILFFTGFYCEGWLVLKDEKNVLITDSRYFSAAKSVVDLTKFELINGSQFCDVKPFLESVSRVGVDFSTFTARELRLLEENGFEVVDSTDEINSLLAAKSSIQLETIEKACKIAENAFSETLKFVKEGVSELDLASELEYRFKKGGASGTSFETIVAFGKNSAIPHHKTDLTRLEKNSAVLMDFGCNYHGFCSDMTRTFFLGKADDEFKKAYQAVLEAHLTAKNQIVSGMSGYDADKIARDCLKKYGYDKYFTHSLGHGIGTLIHEFPTLSPRSKSMLNNGNVFSIEPGVYFDDKFGIRIEDTVTLENGKVKSFMSYTKELFEL